MPFCQPPFSLSAFFTLYFPFLISFCPFCFVFSPFRVLFVCSPQIRFALCGGALLRRIEKAAQSYTPTPLCLISLFCNSSIAYLRRLVGLRLLRLCPFLVSKVEQEIYSDRALPCTHNGFHPWTFCSLRSWVLLLCIGA